MDAKEITRRFNEVDDALRVLTNKDPESALRSARALAADGILDDVNVGMLRAATLINAGAEMRDAPAVHEGVAILRKLLEALPDRCDLAYNLANGLTAQADLVRSAYPQWYLETMDLRREARRLYRSAGEANSAPPLVAGESFTNLGNSLARAGRYAEAYDSYLRALGLDPTNGVALTGAARILLRFVKDGIGDADVLRGVAAQHLKTARLNPERIRDLAGEQAYRDLSGLLQTEIPDGHLLDLSSASEYQRFVAKHRLALAPTIEGLDLAMRRWDSLRIDSVTESIDTEYGVPPLFAMFNVLKSDYLAARYLAYTALADGFPESGKYSDTLDYACYGVRSSVLTLAQRACMDLLDKVAVAASEYLDLPEPSKSIYFTNRWYEARKDGGPMSWQPPIREEIEKGNLALVALSEVSGDIAVGFLQEKRALRHASTHRFTVLHDFGRDHVRKCGHVDHYDCAVFEEQLIESLQLARAVLFYFVEMVRVCERQETDSGSRRVPLIVPDHDWVRGDDGP